MKALSLLRRIGALAVGILLVTRFVWAQAPDALRVYPAIEVEFLAEAAKLYMLESSSNLVDWTALDEPICGTGLSIHQLFATRTPLNPATQFYRLRIAGTNCANLQPRGLVLLGEPAALTAALNLLGVGGLKARTNSLPNSNDAVLFTISLTDGPMPQTQEQILAIQGKQHGPAAIFLINGFANPDTDLRELVLLETKDLLKKYQQPGVDALPVLYDDNPAILSQIRDLILNGVPP